MKISEAIEKLNLQLLTKSDVDREITGVYACDLLSRVMGSLESGDAWITVQTHLNILAVADLDDAACIIVSEGIQVEQATIDKANEKELCVLASPMKSYELCWRLHELM